MVRNKVLIICPAFDTITNYMSFYVQKAIDDALRQGFDVTVLWKAYANREQFDCYTGSNSDFSPDLVIIASHGGPDGEGSRIADSDFNSIIEKDVNDSQLRDRSVIALSCYTGLQLGNSVVKKGALFYSGFNDAFISLAGTGNNDGGQGVYAIMDTYVYTQVLAAIRGATASEIKSAVENKKLYWKQYFTSGEGVDYIYREDLIGLKFPPGLLEYNWNIFVTLGQDNLNLEPLPDYYGKLLQLGLQAGIGLGTVILSALTAVFLYKKLKK